MNQSIIQGYADSARDLVPAFEALPSRQVLAPIADFLPMGCFRVVEVGAGSGRDAAFLAARGSAVLAVEPVAAFREAGASRHPSPRIEWLDDCLPALVRTLQRGDTFDLVLLVAVWQHLDSPQRAIAMANLRRLASVGGRLVLSIRHGPGAEPRTCFAASADDTIELARRNGFGLLARRQAESVQARNRDAGVTWTWLVFLAM